MAEPISAASWVTAWLEKAAHDLETAAPRDEAALRQTEITAGKLVLRKRGASGAVLPNTVITVSSAVQGLQR